MRIETIPLFWCIFILVAGVVSALFGRRRDSLSDQPRIATYSASALGLVIPVAITAAIAVLYTKSSFASLTTTLPAPVLAEWSAGLAAICILITIAFQVWGARRGRALSEIATRLLPVSASEFIVYFGLCMIVGFSEEYLYRGFALSLLGSATHSIFISATIVTVAFALNHLVQGVAAIPRAFLLGGILAASVIITGSLWPAIIAHVFVNAFTGSFGRVIARFLIKE